jgi:hypothetical protein
MAAKRMLNDNYDKYNVNSVFVESNFEGTLFLGTAFTNIALKNCSGIDSLRTRKRCGFINVVITDTEHNQTYAIPNDEDFRHPW